MNEGSLAFAHNGVINNVDQSKDYTRSDTWHFNTSMMKHLYDKFGADFIEDPVLQELIVEYIGYSKLAFLTDSGRCIIFNKNKGDMNEGVWYSNTSYKQVWGGKKQKNSGYGTQYSGNSNQVSRNEPVVGNTYDALGRLVEKAMSESAANDPISTALVPTNSPIISPVVAVSPKSFGPSPSSILRVNDYIEITTPYKDLGTSSMGLIMAILNHGMVQARMWDTGRANSWKIREIPIGVFRKYSDGSQFQEDYLQ